MFYYTLGNLRPELRSTHRAVQLIACVTSVNLEKYGFGAVLEPFIKDVNDLCRVSIQWHAPLCITTPLDMYTCDYKLYIFNFLHILNVPRSPLYEILSFSRMASICKSMERPGLFTELHLWPWQILWQHTNLVDTKLVWALLLGSAEFA